MPKKILIVGAILNLAIGFTLICKSLIFVSGASSAWGEVVEIQESTRQSKPTMYAPVVEFSDQEGRTHKVYSSSASTRSLGSIGDKIEVLYDPESPELAKLNAFGNIWGVALVFLFIGMALSIGLTVLILAIRFTKPKAGDAPQGV